CSHLCYSILLNKTATTEIYTLSLHDALPIYENKPVGSKAGTHLAGRDLVVFGACADATGTAARERPRNADTTRSSGCSRTGAWRSEEHTSELQSRENLVCRLLLEKKKTKNKN